MTERQLREMLSQPVELPAEVEERLREACAGIGRRTEKRRPRRALRTALLAACLAAGLCLAATAGYAVVRGEKAPDLGAALEGLFGNESRPSLQAQTEFDETGGQALALPDRERVPLDGEQTEALLGDYLPETGYVWQIGEYTLTVESWLLDEHTGAGRVYFTLERPGGVEGLQVAPEDGETWADGSGITLNFCVLNEDGEWDPAPYRFYADQGRSTTEKLCLTAALAERSGWKAADGLRIQVRDLSRNVGSEKDVSLLATLELPGTDSLPALSALDPATGEEKARLSAIGLCLAAHVDQVEAVALEYDDGSTYLVQDKAAGLQNTEYALGDGEGERLTLVFNRLVDPARVAAVAVDGVRYPVE